ncbi:MAG: hypothetical protein CFE45_10195, partial [Burkholderiales bacterium PBB5]
ESGYDTPLGEGGARLSVGQKQLIAMARALAGQPRILLLDEATAHIDSETEALVQQVLAGLRGQVTVVAIAHRLSTIREADQIVVLNHGHLAEIGSHAQLMARPQGLYQRLVQLQQLASQDDGDDGDDGDEGDEGDVGGGADGGDKRAVTPGTDNAAPGTPLAPTAGRVDPPVQP